MTCALALFALAATACTKEEQPVQPTPNDTTDTTPDNPVPDYSTLIMGRWNAVLDCSYERYTEDDYNETTFVSDWATALSLTFKDDGYLTYSAIVSGFEDSWDDLYRIQSDTLVWDTKPYKILTINDNQLVMEYRITEDRTTSGGTTYTTTLTKHWEFNR